MVKEELRKLAGQVKRTRLVGSALGTGVSEAIQETVTMGRKTLRFGVVSHGTPFWEWTIKAGGHLVWLWGSRFGTRYLERMGVDAWSEDTLALAELGARSPVDVVLFDGPGPKAQNDVWRMDSVNVIIWTNGSRCCPPSSKAGDWNLESGHLVHSQMGGVTTSTAHFKIARRVVSTASANCERLSDWRFPNPVGLTGATLRGIVDPTLPGRKCPALEEIETDPLDTLLDLTRVGDTLKLPSVFIKESVGRVRRLLVPKEILLAMDLPSTLLKQATDNEMKEWVRELKVPFKGRFELVRSLGLTLGDLPCQTQADSGRSVRSCPLPEEQKDIKTSADHQKPPSDMKPPVTTEDPATSHLKATKADDADVPVHLWNDRIQSGLSSLCEIARRRLAGGSDPGWANLQKKFSPGEKRRLKNHTVESALSRLLEGLRRLALRKWKALVRRSFWTWWKSDCKGRAEQGLAPCRRAADAGIAALVHASHASWWDWDQGSAPFFWRFPIEWQVPVRDGLPPCFTGEPPVYTKAQRPPSDPNVKAKEKEKISKVRARGYICGFTGILALLNFFSVSKGTHDVRMVYDGTKSGLNAVLFAPWFALASVDSMLRSVGPGYWSADNDYGEMFLNFWLHPELRKYCGVDLTGLFPDEAAQTEGLKLWEAWARCAMGLRPSPYQAVQTGLQLKHIAMGNRSDPKNVFRWQTVRLNLPGCAEYDPTLPWVSKVREDASIAADVHQYVDDIRVTSATEEEAWLASSKVAKTAAYHGCQDAARKRRPPRLLPGAWAGAIIETTEDAVYKRVSQERWEKTQASVNQVATWLNSSTRARIPRKDLERIRGFLVYVALTYTIMTPYLRGIHLTLESWRPDRDEDGWRKVSDQGDSGLAYHLENSAASDSLDIAEAPMEVRAVPRLVTDIAALQELTSSKTPPDVLVRPTDSTAVLIIYGDASGTGFGLSLWVPGSTVISVEYGTWTREYSAKSSNHREMYNFVRKLMQMLRDGALRPGTELFIFTDNQVTESAFYKGTSKSKTLFDLVLQLKKLEMEGQLFLHVVWVAGTRMIAQGTDGFSRGDLENGVATGASMLSFVPLNETAFERQPNLETWILSTIPLGVWCTLDSTGWYERGHTPGNYVWAPPPAAAPAALEQLCEAKHIRPDCGHVFVCPALMTPRWRRKLGKIADFVFHIPVGSSVWSKDQHEPLIVGLICPLLSSSPWQVRHCGSALARVRQGLSQVWSEDQVHERDTLRELWTFAWDRKRV